MSQIRTQLDKQQRMIEDLVLRKPDKVDLSGGDNRPIPVTVPASDYTLLNTL